MSKGHLLPHMRNRVLYLFKELVYLGKDYPEPYEKVSRKLKKAFRAKKDLKDPSEIEKALALGEHVKNEMIALYKLRTYRAVKNNYYKD